MIENFLILLPSSDGKNTGHFQIRFQILLYGCHNRPKSDFSLKFHAERTVGFSGM